MRREGKKKRVNIQSEPDERPILLPEQNPFRKKEEAPEIFQPRRETEYAPNIAPEREIGTSV